MSKTKGLLGGLLVAVALAAVAFSASVIDRGSDAEAAHTPGDIMSIRHTGGDPGPFGGGTPKIAFVGVPFNAEIWIDASSAPQQGYQWEIAYDPTYLVHTGVNTELQTGIFSLCAGAAAVPFGPFIIYGQGAGCLSPSAPNQFVGQVTNIGLQCIAPTSAPPFATAVALIAADPAEDALTDPIFGTSLIDPGGVLRPTSTVFKGPNPAGGTIAQIVVVCLLPTDVSLVKADSADPVAAPGTYQYTLTVGNASGSAQTVNIADTLTANAGVTFTAVDSGCSFTATTVTCTGLAVPAMGSTVVTIDVAVTASAACTNASNTASASVTTPGFADVNPGNNSDTETTAIACTGLVVTKAADDTSITAGGSVTYTYTVCNTAGSSTATNVTLVDSNAAANPISNQPIVSIAGGTCSVGPHTATVTFPTAGTFCNTAVADPDNGPPATSNQVCVTVIPAFEGITKDTESGDIEFSLVQNVWLCKPLGADIPGEQDDCGELVFDELGFGAFDVDTCNDDDNGDGFGCNSAPGPDGICGTLDDVSTSSDWDGDIGDLDPICDADNEVGEGLGAFEFQIKFDHKLFQHPNIECVNDGPGGDVLDDTGRVVMGTMDIITENWVLVGCVTKEDCDDDGDPGPFDCDQPGPDIGGGGRLVRVTFNTQPDLLERIRPTKDNGVRADLLDENCELADTLGSPFNMEVEPGGSNEAPNGGLSEDCDDITVTIRMLEGDIDLDCDVDVVDDQMIAFRYGATFGVLTYDPFFDLEPNTTPTDFDIDIKDLQFVFGRNGSTCDVPIPDQEPQPAVPDP